MVPKRKRRNKGKYENKRVNEGGDKKGRWSGDEEGKENGGGKRKRMGLR